MAGGRITASLITTPDLLPRASSESLFPQNDWKTERGCTCRNEQKCMSASLEREMERRYTNDMTQNKAEDGLK